MLKNSLKNERNQIPIDWDSTGELDFLLEAVHDYQVTFVDLAHKYNVSIHVITRFVIIIFSKTFPSIRPLKHSVVSIRKYAQSNRMEFLRTIEERRRVLCSQSNPRPQIKLSAQELKLEDSYELPL